MQKLMRAAYDFSKGKRGALIAQPRKTRITIYIDNAVLDEFRGRAKRAGTGYQTMMNEALRAFLARSDAPVTEAVLRQVIRGEFLRISRPATPSGPPKNKRRAGQRTPSLVSMLAGNFGSCQSFKLGFRKSKVESRPVSVFSR
jgi:hypothetical protein